MLTSGYTEIDDIISRLEKEEIIGDNPMKHLERNKIVCKLEVKDPNFIIQNKKIEFTNENIKDYEMHISELLRLRVIQKSISRHKSLTFIINKHSELGEKVEW